MKRILIVSPHFSTGGAPQVTLSKIRMLKPHFEIAVIEHSFLAWQFVVQREQVISCVGRDNFLTLSGNNYEKGEKIYDIIQEWKPHYVSMEEFPEMFMDTVWASKIYEKPRPYVITETTHDSSFPVSKKVLYPDKFVFISPYSKIKYAHLDTPKIIIEYPVDKIKRDKLSAQKQLGLKYNFKHVVIVGLFTPRKNQSYAFELAEKLEDYNIIFHFLGNQAENFKYYWEPLMANKPNNCIVWGERKDVNMFLQASDLFLFTSKGDRGNKELNPIVIKEASEYEDLPKLLYNLDVYLNKYNSRQDFNFLTGDPEVDRQNIINISGAINMKVLQNEELIIVGTYPNLKKREELTRECISSLLPLNRKILLVSHYPVPVDIQGMVDFYIYDKYNPLIHHSYYTRFFNYMPDYDVEININGLKNSNQTLTVLTNLYNAYKAADGWGFKRAFYVTYDVVVNEKDYDIIEETFTYVRNQRTAYLSKIKTPFEYGIQTTAMNFDVQFFLRSFDDVRDGEKFNKVCHELQSQNFLEDYMAKVSKFWHGSDYMLTDTGQDTFLVNSGLGVSSNSEYYSIVPVVGKKDMYMFYFYTYNIDDREVLITIKTSKERIQHKISIKETKEYKIPIYFSGSDTSVVMEFLDHGKIYKKETYHLTPNNISNYSNTGFFKWKVKPRVKLVHMQTTLSLEKEIQSWQQLSKVSEYSNWTYVLHRNEPYKDLPPANNCQRPQCVSMELFDEQEVARLGTALTPAHYGCYEAFKLALLTEFDEEYDFIMLCEGDCKIEMDISEFVSKVEASCESIQKYNIGIMSYGDKSTLEHGWFQSPLVQDIPGQDMYITNHIIGLQAIMFPKSIKKWLFDKLRTHPWDGADMYFNSIFRDAPYKMGIVKSRYTSQFDGYSLIDKQEKKFI